MNYTEDGGEPIVDAFKDFYIDWSIIEGEDVITIERNKENDRSLYLTANDNADGQEAYVKVRVMHLNEEGEAERDSLERRQSVHEGKD